MHDAGAIVDDGGARGEGADVVKIVKSREGACGGGVGGGGIATSRCKGVDALGDRNRCWDRSEERQGAEGLVLADVPLAGVAPVLPVGLGADGGSDFTVLAFDDGLHKIRAVDDEAGGRRARRADGIDERAQDLARQLGDVGVKGALVLAPAQT